MTAPRLEIHLERLDHNARTLVDRLGRAGIAICGVSKATLGLPEIVATWIAAGVPSIGESRIASIEALHRSCLPVPLLMVRSPMLHEVERVVAHAAISCNSEAVVLRALAAAAQAQGLRHGVLLMVELGDLREGILPIDLEAIVQLTLTLPNLQQAAVADLETLLIAHRQGGRRPAHDQVITGGPLDHEARSAEAGGIGILFAEGEDRAHRQVGLRFAAAFCLS